MGLTAEDGEDRLHVVAGEPRDQHGCATYRLTRRFDLVGLQRIRVQGLEDAREFELLADRQFGVGHDVLLGDIDQAPGR